MMRAGMIILVGGLMAAACSSVPSYRPAPLQTASGKLGFSVSGIASFTRDEAKVTEEVRAMLEKSCGGEIELQSIVFADATSRGGVPHLAYTAEAECKS